MRILFLDDNPARHDLMDARYPLDEIVHVYNIDKYREALEAYDHFDMISLDHDLNDFGKRKYIGGYGDCDLTGRDACGYLMRYLHKAPEVIHIHSSNPDGAHDMMSFLDSRGVKNRWIIFNDNPYVKKDY